VIQKFPENGDGILINRPISEFGPAQSIILIANGHVGHYVSILREKMRRKIQIMPGKITSSQAKIGIVIISMFIVFGLVMARVALNDAPGEDASFVVAIGAFFLIWIVACIGLIVFFSRLIKAAKNSPADSLAEIRIENDASTNDFETRLRSLEKLKEDGLISEEEYRLKRSQILEDKW